MLKTDILEIERMTEIGAFLDLIHLTVLGRQKMEEDEMMLNRISETGGVKIDLKLTPCLFIWI